MIIKNIPQGVSRELKCLIMKCSDLVCLCLSSGENVRLKLFLFGEDFPWDVSLRSVCSLTNATWFDFIGSAAGPRCPSGLPVWLMQCKASLICASSVGVNSNQNWLHYLVSLIQEASNLPLKCRHVMMSFLHSDGWWLHCCDWLFM